MQPQPQWANRPNSCGHQCRTHHVEPAALLGALDQQRGEQQHQQRGGGVQLHSPQVNAQRGGGQAQQRGQVCRAAGRNCQGWVAACMCGRHQRGIKRAGINGRGITGHSQLAKPRDTAAELSVVSSEMFQATVLRQPEVGTATGRWAAGVEGGQQRRARHGRIWLRGHLESESMTRAWPERPEIDWRQCAVASPRRQLAE